MLVLLTGLCLPGPSPAAPAGQIRIKNLKVLCVCYCGEPGRADYIDAAGVQQVRNGVELGRVFYFRNSRARLNLEIHWRVYDEPAPDTAGPNMDQVERHLLDDGVQPGAYDGVFVTGPGLSGNFGGFVLLGGAGGCFGGHDVRGDLEWYPEDQPTVAYGTAWTFVHEFQHALDLVICADSQRADMLHDHPYVDRQEEHFKWFYRGGEHWDWVAVCLREFDGYDDVTGLTNGFIECVDADRDGLPDDDPRLPADERRFGSDPGQRDTDGDGLDDLGEFTADRYAGSDPRRADTDQDRILDAADPYPLIAIRPRLYWNLDELLLTGVFARNDGRPTTPPPAGETGDCYVSGSWTESSLELRCTGPRPFTLHLKIDGSAANGFWEGGDTYLIRARGRPESPGGTVEFDGLGLSGPVPNATLETVFAKPADEPADVAGTAAKAPPGPYTMVLRLPAELGQGVSHEVNHGAARAAADVCPGLTLASGREIGLNIIYEFADGARALLTPLHTMYTTRLWKPAEAPEIPVLRGPHLTNAAVPTVEVLGISGDASVAVVAGDLVVGRRIGPGLVYLCGSALASEATYELTARVEGRTENAKTAQMQQLALLLPAAQPARPFHLTIDRTAAPPELSIGSATANADATESSRTLQAQCEPKAVFELWWGRAGVPVAQVDGARADQLGQVRLPLNPSFRGWLVRAYRGSSFEELVHLETWPLIDRNWRAGPPDAHLPADAFSYRLETYLPVAQAGRHAFELTSDDGARLWLDGELLINHWGRHGMSPQSATANLTRGLHSLRIDYCELDGWAGLRLRFAASGRPLSSALPVVRIPLLFEPIQVFGVQTDALGNRSAFSRPLEIGSPTELSDVPEAH